MSRLLCLEEAAGLEAAIATLKRVVGALEPECLSADEAAQLVATFTEGERLCASGKALAARRVAESGLSRHEAVRQSRYLRHWTDPDGALRLDGRMTVDAGAKVLAALEPHRERVFADAREAGRRLRAGPDSTRRGVRDPVAPDSDAGPSPPPEPTPEQAMAELAETIRQVGRGAPP